MSQSHSHHQKHGNELSTRPLLWSIAINLALSVFQFIAGFISSSSALLADALHNTNDAAALVVAFVARKISQKPPNSRFTFGYRRAELIGALIQLTALVIVGGFLVVHAIERFLHPEPVNSGWMIFAATIAIIIDLATVGLLWATSKGSLNVRAAFLHNVSDAGASVAVLAGGLAMLYFDWTWIDPLLTLLIAGFIIVSSIKLLRRTCLILMEATPEDIDLAKIKSEAETVVGVADLHHLHVWELDEDHRSLEAHIVIADETSHRQPEIKAELKGMFKDQFSISHSTLEFERSTEACRREKADLVPAP